MKAVCFEGVERVGVRDVPDPVIEDACDAIVEVRMAGLCGSDLHPYFGRESGLDPGTVMGHEFVGTVVETGRQITRVAVGERVGAPFSTSCGECFFCLGGLTARCVQGQLFGWRSAGVGLHGGQAQYLRVPLADSTLLHVPDDLDDETALLLGDNLSTGRYCAEMAGVEPDGVYGVIGCGTVGLLAIAWSLRLGATSVYAFDPVPERGHIARRLGARVFADERAYAEAIADATKGRGADAVMEVVGLPDAQRLAYRSVRAGGTLAVIGCHAEPHFAFSPADAYDKNLIYRTGRCPARHYMPRIADELGRQPMDLGWCITHRFGLDEGKRAYDVFAHRRYGCVKAVLKVGGRPPSRLP